MPGLETPPDDIAGSAVDAKGNLASVGERERQTIDPRQHSGFPNARDVNAALHGGRSFGLAVLSGEVVVDPEREPVLRGAKHVVSGTHGTDARYGIEKAFCHDISRPRILLSDRTVAVPRDRGNECAMGSTALLPWHRLGVTLYFKVICDTLSG